MVIDSEVVVLDFRRGVSDFGHVLIGSELVVLGFRQVVFGLGEMVDGFREVGIGFRQVVFGSELVVFGSELVLFGYRQGIIDRITFIWSKKQPNFRSNREFVDRIFDRIAGLSIEFLIESPIFRSNCDCQSVICQSNRGCQSNFRWNLACRWNLGYRSNRCRSNHDDRIGVD